MSGVQRKSCSDALSCGPFRTSDPLWHTQILKGNGQIKTGQNNSYAKKLPKTGYVCENVKKSERQIKGKLSNTVQIEVCHLH